jgi:prepilin-type N-terminal cleavage/methylation domain-containing protein
VSSNNKGFTLVELLISVTISVVAMAMIYAGYKSQQEAHTNERLVVDMQQNGRSALAFMRREIRMAGSNPWAWDGRDNNANGSRDDADPTELNAVRGFLTVRSNLLNFTMDLSTDPVTLEPGNGNDTDANENITYGFNAADDPDGDGIANAGAAALSRKDRSDTAAPYQPLAFDIHAIAFAYAFDVDGDGALDTYPGAPGIVIWAYDSNGDGSLDRHLDTNMDGLIDENDNPGGANLAPVVNRDRVHAVQVWILTRSQVPMKGRNAAAQSFVIGPHHITANDGFKRAVFNSMITARNPL